MGDTKSRACLRQLMDKGDYTEYPLKIPPISKRLFGLGPSPIIHQFLGGIENMKGTEALHKA